MRSDEASLHVLILSVNVQIRQAMISSELQIRRKGYEVQVKKRVLFYSWKGGGGGGNPSLL